jgi:outer membrane immunogenic protein
MKKQLVVAAAFMVSAGAASAADIPVKAPAMKAPPLAVADWSGFYIGGHGGWGLGHYRGTYDDAGDFDPMDFRRSGWLGGGQIGYHWQFGRMVYGVEADATWTDFKTSVVDNENDLREFKTDFLGSVRFRSGITTNNFLLFTTIGIGYAHSKFTVFDDVPSPAVQKLNGWGLVTGFGGEWMFAPNWSLRGEYLYYDIRKRANMPGLTTDSEPTDFAKVDGFHVVRAAVNYRFGGTGMMTSPASAPVANWTGFYIGGHGGYGRSRIVGVYDEFGDSGSFDIDPRGFVGGGQIGYNWQSGQWVYGIEGDVTWSGMKKSRVDTESDTEELKTNLLASIRARLGVAADDKLYYVTGGAGYGRSKLTVTGSDSPSPATATVSTWAPVVGAGFEWAFAPKWTMRIEGLTYLFNKRLDIPGLTNDSDPLDYIRQSTVFVTRAGLNVRF